MSFRNETNGTKKNRYWQYAGVKESGLRDLKNLIYYHKCLNAGAR